MRKYLNKIFKLFNEKIIKQITLKNILKIKIPVYLRKILLFVFMIIIAIIYNKLNKFHDIGVNLQKQNINFSAVNKVESNNLENSDNYFEKDTIGEKEKMVEHLPVVIVNDNEMNSSKKSTTEVIKINNEDNTITGQVKENKKSQFANFNSTKKIAKKYNSVKDGLLNVSSNDYYFGSIEAPVTIVEYSSYLCPHCVDFNKNVMPYLKSDYIDKNKVRYVKRIIAQEDTLIAVMLPFCAKRDTQYNLVDNIYNNTNKWQKMRNRQKAVLKEISIASGFTDGQFEECVKDKTLARKILEKQEMEVKGLNIYSTPTFFINGVRVEGDMPYSDFKVYIDKELKRQEKLIENSK